jgi:hypothetical protein
VTTARSDLLSVTRTLLRWAFWLDCFFVLLLAVLFVGVLVRDGSTLSIHTGADLTPAQKLIAARVGLGGGLAACILTLPVLRLLLAIVDTARKGDPFVPENAARLRRAGWLLLAVNISLTITFEATLKGRITFPPISFYSLLTVLMVFVIARIFEVGTRMRTELQGTV